MTTRIALATAILLSFLDAAPAAPVILDFNNLSDSQLVVPYMEEGFTVSMLSPGIGIGICGGRRGDGYVCGSTTSAPVRFRIYGETPFDLVSLDVESVFRNWRIESPTGSIVPLTSSEFQYATPGTIHFDALDGWRGIDYFEIVHDAGQASANINVDNIRVSPVPEPSSLALATGLAAMGICLRRRRRLRSPSGR